MRGAHRLVQGCGTQLCTPAERNEVEVCVCGCAACASELINCGSLACSMLALMPTRWCHAHGGPPVNLATVARNSGTQLLFRSDSHCCCDYIRHQRGMGGSEWTQRGVASIFSVHGTQPLFVAFISCQMYVEL
jgi:hypothetical protein